MKVIKVGCPIFSGGHGFNEVTFDGCAGNDVTLTKPNKSAFNESHLTSLPLLPSFPLSPFLPSLPPSPWLLSLSCILSSLASPCLYVASPFVLFLAPTSSLTFPFSSYPPSCLPYFLVQSLFVPYFCLISVSFSPPFSLPPCFIFLSGLGRRILQETYKNAVIVYSCIAVLYRFKYAYFACLNYTLLYICTSLILFYIYFSSSSSSSS